MKFELYSKSGSGRARMLLALLPIGLGLGLTACAGNLHNRWATETDTLTTWQDAMATMPVEMHADIEAGQGRASAVSVPHAVTPAEYAARHPLDAPLDSMPRVSVYLGRSGAPAPADYCGAAQSRRQLAARADKINVTAALCDGHRLVVMADYQFTPEQLGQQGEARVVHAMKEHLLFALATNPSAPSMGQ